MVSGGVAQRLDLSSAMCTNKSVVIFGKPFLFHRFPLDASILYLNPITKTGICQGPIRFSEKK
jgi:hypothetical protein